MDLDPSLIYQGQPGSIQNAWLQGFNPDSHRARIISSSSGWSNNDIGLQWLKQVFDPATKAKARSSYRLLFMDGHQSHLTMDFIDYCDQNKILLAIFPPHATHTLQPLDVALFKPLSTAYSNELSGFMDQCRGRYLSLKPTSSRYSGEPGRPPSRNLLSSGRLKLQAYRHSIQR
jgi:hypothetical protein